MSARNLALLVLFVTPMMAWPQEIAAPPASATQEIKAEPSESLTEVTYAVADLVVPIPTQILFMVAPRVIINLEETIVAPKPIPRVAIEPSINNRVVHAHATVPAGRVVPAPKELVAPIPVGNTTIPNVSEVVQARATNAISGTTSDGATEVSKKQFSFKLRLCEGDPLGSQETDTLTILAEPTLTALENQSFSFHAGGSCPVPEVRENGIQGSFLSYGVRITGQAASVKDGKVRMTIDVSCTDRPIMQGERIQLHTEGCQTIMTVKLGEIQRFRIGKGTGDKQMWVELTIQKYHGPDNAGR
ncbi:MAG TPA: hypothetical protein VNX28_06570 [Gemmataceae bacterium]|nr:hypothetical protein [Gemmataceae bacterium]